jgi:hypothetical protein
MDSMPTAAKMRTKRKGGKRPRMPRPAGGLPSVIVLYASQLYACKIMYDLGSRFQKAHAAEEIDLKEREIDRKNS